MLSWIILSATGTAVAAFSARSHFPIDTVAISGGGYTDGTGTITSHAAAAQAGIHKRNARIRTEYRRRVRTACVAATNTNSSSDLWALSIWKLREMTDSLIGFTCRIALRLGFAQDALGQCLLRYGVSSSRVGSIIGQQARIPPGRRSLGTLPRANAGDTGCALVLDSLQITDDVDFDAWLPASLASDLPDLTSLTLMGNGFSVLPASVGLLRNLQALDLSANQLHALPNEICECTQLRVLFAIKNRITQLPANFGQLANLQELALSSNGIKYLPPDSPLFDLQRLKVLFLNYNGLTEVPGGIRRLKSLEKLGIGFNFITELPPWTGTDLPHLHELFLKCNRLHYLPAELFIQKRNIHCQTVCNLPLQLTRVVTFASGSLVSVTALEPDRTFAADAQGSEATFFVPMDSDPTADHPSTLRLMKYEPATGSAASLEKTNHSHHEHIVRQLAHLAVDARVLDGKLEISLWSPPLASLRELCCRALATCPGSLFSHSVDADTQAVHVDYFESFPDLQQQCSVCFRPVVDEWLVLLGKIRKTPTAEDQTDLPLKFILCSAQCLDEALHFVS